MASAHPRSRVRPAQDTPHTEDFACQALSTNPTPHARPSATGDSCTLALTVPPHRGTDKHGTRLPESWQMAWQGRIPAGRTGAGPAQSVHRPSRTREAPGSLIRDDELGSFRVAPVHAGPPHARGRTPRGIWAVPSFVRAAVWVSLGDLSPLVSPVRKTHASNLSKPAGAGGAARTVMYRGARLYFVGRLSPGGERGRSPYEEGLGACSA